MLNLNNISISEFEKCGVILVAAKRNKIAMSCNFCPEMFSQLQAFMRHLQQQHDDKLEFLKQGREIEVYAVEELINQTAVACVLDAQSESSNLVEEDAKWLCEADKKWLDEGVEPEKRQQHGKELSVAKCDDEEEGLNMSNLSILKALEDCDVSFNLMHNLNSTRCSEEEKESYLDNSLLREIQRDWEDSDTNESVLKRIDCTDQDVLNCSKYLMEISNELNADVTMPDLLLNKTCVEEENLTTTNKIFETSPSKCIKSILKGLDGLDDVDSLLEDLESTLTTNRSTEIVGNESNTKIFSCQDLEKNVKDNISPQTNFAKTQNLNNSDSIDFLLNTKCENQLTNFNQDVDKNLVESKQLENNFKDFETRLKELENALEEDISNSSNFEIKNTNVENCEPNLALQLKNLEESLNDHKNVCNNETINNSVLAQHNFDIQLNKLEESLKETEESVGCSNKILEENETTSETNIDLNEDLTKALADALDENDLNLLNIQQGDSEEPINEDILNLLERELIDDELNEELPLLKKKHTTDQENKKIKTLKNQRKILNIHKNNGISKYKKTNLKARTKILKTQIKNSIKSNNSFILTESNLINSVSMVKDSQKPLKGNHEIFLSQKNQTSKNNSLNNHMKTKTPLKTINNELSTSFGERKSPKENQENTTSAINIRNIKNEKLTPATNFVNMSRGDKTPIKREVIFFKQSPKTQEKQETLIKNITPKRGDKTPQEVKIKQSPKTQEKQENVNQQKKTPKTRQKTPQPKSNEKLKHSPKEKLNEPLHSDQTSKPQEKVAKEQKSPLNSSNEKRSPPTQTSTNSYNLHNNMRTPLTTPQRLRNVTIKLQRFTPDKVPQQFKRQDGTHLETKPHKMQDATKQKVNTFILPEGISLTRVCKQSSSPDTNECAIIETPIKTTAYCKRNFSESSLEIVEQDETKKQSPIEVKSSLILAQSETINDLKSEENISNIRQRKASIDIVPSTQGNDKKPSQASVNNTPQNNNVDYISYAVNRTARKNEVLQRMRQIKKQIFKSIEEREGATKSNDIKSHPIKPQKKKILIENVQILPNLNDEKLANLTHDFKKPFNDSSTTTTKKTVSLKNLSDHQKQAKVLAGRAQLDSSNKDKEKVLKSLKRPASSPPLNENQQAKRQHKSSAKEQPKVLKKTSNLEKKQLDLSENVEDILQRDLKANRLSVEDLLNEDLPEDDCTPDETSVESSGKDTKIEKTSKDEETSNYTLLNDLLEQVNNEQTTKEKRRKKTVTDKEETTTNTDTVEDFDNSKDIDLLSKFGLKIIKIPEIEDTISLEERDKMNEKAMKFSNIYRNYPKVWSTKHSDSQTLKQDLNLGFKQLLAAVNQGFNLKLNIVEIKRLANLINIWYTHNFSNKLIEKRKISESINRHLCMFHYIPKTIKRFYYCEFCEEYLNTEHKYFTHRIIHTGALYPYTCQKCFMGFKAVKFHQNHESKCNVIISDKNWKVNPNSYANIKLRTRYKCQLCAEMFETSELLYEHSKTHLKNTYSCAKCELVFATAMDVQNHMTACNTSSKRMPKQCTPRPQRQN